MKAVESYHEHALKDDAESLANRYEFMTYELPTQVLAHVKNLLLPGRTVALFSGSWRLNLDADYIELKMFKNSTLNFHKSTLFIESDQLPLFNLTMTKLSPVNLLMLHNDWWTGHTPIDQLLFRLDQFLKYVKPNQGQIICSLPLIHINFNKLVTELDDLALLTNGIIVDDSLVIVRK